MSHFSKLIFLFIVISLFTNCTKKKVSDNDVRSFYMGFTPFPYDNSLEALKETYQHVIHDGDIVLIHLDNGVPWNEALNDLAFPINVENDLNRIKNTIPATHKIFLTATPNHIDRESLAHYWNNNGTQQDLPFPWNTYSFDHPDVITAYIKYCKRIIDKINPDYFAFGIEVNGGLKLNTPQYNNFLTLADTVYKRLKKDYPKLSVLMTFQDKSFNKTQQELYEVTKKLMNYSDIMAVSTYPFWFYDFPTRPANPIYIPENWLQEMKNLAPDKAFAIAETGFIAEDMNIPAYNIHIKGTPQWQEEFTKKLFNKASNLNAEFICWFVYRDYDLLYQHLNNPPDYFLIWKDNGMVDGNGKERPSLQTWRKHLAYEKKL